MGGRDEALLRLIAEQQKMIERLTATLERMAPAESVQVQAGPTFGDVFKRYAKVKTATNPKFGAWRYQFVVKYFAKKRADGVDSEAWAGYSVARMSGALTDGRKVKHNTINNELSLTAAMLSWAARERIISGNGLASVRKTKVVVKGQGALREEHLPAVLAAAPSQMLRVFIIVAIDTGLRKFELLSLTWKDVDYAAGLIRIVGKGTKVGEVVVTKRALEALRSLPRRRDSDPVFMNPETGRAYHASWIGELVALAINESGIEKHYGGKKIRIHAFRHGHATNTLEAGVPIHHVKAQLRHSSISTTERYLHERLDQRRESLSQKYEAKLDARKGPHRAPPSNENDEREEPRSIFPVQAR